MGVHGTWMGKKRQDRHLSVRSNRSSSSWAADAAPTLLLPKDTVGLSLGLLADPLDDDVEMRAEEVGGMGVMAYPAPALDGSSLLCLRGED